MATPTVNGGRLFSDRYRSRWRVLRDTRPGQRHLELYLCVQVEHEGWPEQHIRLRGRGTFEACVTLAHTLETAEVARRRALGLPLMLEHGPEEYSELKRGKGRVDPRRVNAKPRVKSYAVAGSRGLRRTG